MKARTLGIIALFGVVAVAAVAFCVWRLQVARREAADTSARAKRQAVVSLVAPAPLPLGVPLLGPVGVDAEGYPTQWVDRPAVRSLLSHRKLTELSGFIERFQADFEADPRKEYWPADAAAALDSAEPELRALLDEWVAAAPTSFAPLLARGAYFTAVGFARRGAKWAKDTPNADFDAMADAFAPARADLKRALELRPRAVAAYRGLIQMEAAGGTPAGARHAVDAATATCAACFQIRTVYLLNARPRWGGSYDAMRAYAAAAPVADNRRLALLAGYVDWDLAVIAESEKKYDVALTAIARAIALGDHWAFLLQRASIEARKDDLDAALRDIERAHAQGESPSKALFA